MVKVAEVVVEVDEVDDEVSEIINNIVVVMMVEVVMGFVSRGFLKITKGGTIISTVQLCLVPLLGTIISTVQLCLVLRVLTPTQILSNMVCTGQVIDQITSKSKNVTRQVSISDTKLSTRNHKPYFYWIISVGATKRSSLQSLHDSSRTKH